MRPNERVQSDVNKLQNAWILLRTGGWKQPLVGASINTVFDATSLYVLFIAAGDRISIAALLTGYSIALLLGKATFLPGGVGVVEATMLTIYTSLGAEHPAAVVAVLESCGCLFTREGTHLDCANFGVVLCRKMASGSPATGSCRSGSPRYSRRPRRPEARLR